MPRKAKFKIVDQFETEIPDPRGQPMNWVQTFLASDHTKLWTAVGLAATGVVCLTQQQWVGAITSFGGAFAAISSGHSALKK